MPTPPLADGSAVSGPVPPPPDGDASLRALAAEVVPAFAARFAVRSADGAVHLAVPPAEPAAAGPPGEWTLVLPLAARGEPAGTLVLARDADAPPFAPGDAERAAGWARQAALALDHARLVDEVNAAHAAVRDAVEETHRSWARLRAVAAASRAAAEAAFDLQGVLDATARSVARIVGDLCMVTLVAEGGDELEVRALHHADPEAVALVRRIVTDDPPRRTGGLQGQVLSTGRPLLLVEPTPRELDTWVRPSYHPFVERFGIHSLLIVPLRARERIIGTLTVTRGHGGHPYSDDDWSLLQDIADQAALAVDNARLLGAARDELDRRTRAEEARERTLQELEIERARLAATLESLPVGLYVAEGSAGRIVMSNARLGEIFGTDLPATSPLWSDETRWEGRRPDGSPVAPDEWPIARALRGETVHGDEYECVTPHGTRVWVRSDAAPVREGSGAVVGGVVVVSDIGGERRAQARLEALVRQQATVAELGLRALCREPLPALMELAARRVAEALDVELTKVMELLPRERALVLRAGVGWREGAVGRARVTAGTRSQAGYTLLRDAPVVVRDLATETRFRTHPLLREHGATSGISVVIRRVSRAPYGVLGAHTRTPRDFTPEEAAFLQSVANVLAQALDREEADTARARRQDEDAALAAAGEPRA